MPEPSPVANAITVLAALRRGALDAQPPAVACAEIAPAEAILRAVAQAAGTYVLAELLERIPDPLPRALASAGLAYVGRSIVQATPTNGAQQLIGDTLQFTGTSVAVASILELITSTIESSRPTANPFNGRPRVFMSHSWDESSAFFVLKSRLSAELDYLDHSIHIGKAFSGLTDDELEAQLRLQIRGVHALVVLAHPRALRSRWVKQEIDIAIEFGKPIIAVRPHGTRTRPLPPLLRDVSTDQVGWAAPAIGRRIRGWAEIVRWARDDEAG